MLGRCRLFSQAPSWHEMAMGKALLLLVMCSCVPTRGVTSYEDVQAGATKISSVIEAVLQDQMKAEVLQNEFNQLPRSLQPQSAEEITARGAAAIGRIFREYEQSLQAQAKAVTDAYYSTMLTRSSSTLLSTSSDFYDIEESASLPGGLNFSSNLGVNCSTTYSGYKKASVVTNSDSELGWEAAYSSPLRNLWIDQFSSSLNDVVSFQYFGTPSGLLFVYPYQEWREPYDPRGSPWYTTALVGPKNSIILIDISRQDKLAINKEIAKAILNTLSVHDYVSVFAYGSTVTKLGPSSCIGTNLLSRASQAYILTTIAQIEVLQHSEGLTVKEAYTAAYEDGYSTNCGTNIIINIQGSKDSANSALKRSGWRAFTFATAAGAGSEDVKFICDSDGWYEELDRGSTEEIVYQAISFYNYIFTQNQPSSVANSDEAVSYTYGKGIRSMYHNVDSLGYLLTMSKAVWTSDNTLLGVLGVDIRMANIKDVLDNMQTGVSFPILFSNNGETLYHPEQSEYKKTFLVGTGREISDYESFDVNSNFMTKVRKPMLQLNSGNIGLLVNRPLPKGDATQEGLDTIPTFTYYVWIRLAGTPYKLCMTIGEKDLQLNSQYPPFETRDVYLVTDHILQNAADINQQDFANHGVNFTVINEGNCAENGTNFIRANCTSHPLRYTVDAVSLTSSSVHLAPKCFLSATEAHSYTWSNDDVYGLRKFINQERNATNGPYPSLGDKCLKSARLTRGWFSEIINADHSNTVWVYFGSRDGTLTQYPANYWGNSYDPTRRPWYFRALAVGGKIAFSTPYQDAGGAGLLITVSIAINHNSSPKNTSTTEIVDERVAGVIGYDYVYPVFHNFTFNYANCSNANVQDHLNTSSQPMCFLVDTAGMLLTHSDFLITASEATDLGYVTGTIGTWPIENIFLGKKEPPLASALIDIGFLVPKSSSNRDKTATLSFYETNDTVLDANGVLRGGDIISTTSCAWQGNWSIIQVPRTNAYVLVVDGYKRGNLSLCPLVKPTDLVSIPISYCPTTHDKGASSCVSREIADVYYLEKFKTAEGSCKVFNWIHASSNIGSFVITLSAIGIAITLLLIAFLAYNRTKYVIRATAPTFGYVMCAGALLTFIFLILLIGKPNRSICIGRVWLGTLGFILMFMGLIIRSLRIYLICASKGRRRMKKQIITDWYLMRYIGAFCFVQTVLVTLWVLCVYITFIFFKRMQICGSITC
mmetsp:Transcript_22789/g.38174  ORF Transcript_22789/g.38174 Transcript_22789/m.38174 type:complete len:1216 (-) Transcript_22789:1067-4714(-)